MSAEDQKRADAPSLGVGLFGAAETPLNDMLADLAHELELGWRLTAAAPDEWASHNCGRELSAEVGRVIRKHLADPSPIPKLEKVA